MHKLAPRWANTCVGLALLTSGDIAGAQDLTVRWSGDAQMHVLASTYTTVYGTDWKSAIDPRIKIQANPGDIAIVDDPLVSGGKAIRASMSRSENFSTVANGAPRAELMFPAPIIFAQDNDYLIRWSTYLPLSFEFDSKQLVIVTQIHQSNNSGSPTIALTLLGRQYAISERGGANTTAVSGARWLCCADADRGRWVQWALRYVPDETGQHAYTELYKNGTSVFATRGVPNAYPGDQSAYLKIGLYKPDWINQASDVTSITIMYGPVIVSRR